MNRIIPLCTELARVRLDECDLVLQELDDDEQTWMRLVMQHDRPTIEAPKADMVRALTILVAAAIARTRTADLASIALPPVEPCGFVQPDGTPHCWHGRGDS